MNIIARLEYKLAYCDSTVHRFNHYTTRTPPAFAEVMKMMSHTGLWDVKLTWYSLSTTHWICLYGWEHGLGIHAFRLTWSLMFLQPEKNFLNHVVTALWLAAPSPFVKQNDFIVASTTLLHVHQCNFQITSGLKECTYQHTNYHNTTNHNRYFPWLQLLWSHDICTAN